MTQTTQLFFIELDLLQASVCSKNIEEAFKIFRQLKSSCTKFFSTYEKHNQMDAEELKSDRNILDAYLVDSRGNPISLLEYTKVKDTILNFLRNSLEFFIQEKDPLKVVQLINDFTDLLAKGLLVSKEEFRSVVKYCQPSIDLN